MRKGQFTILVVFGLLALIAIAIVYFATTSIQSETNKEEAEQAVQEFLDSNSVRSYVKSCIQSVSENALQLAGYQGGILWKEQNGTVEKTGTPGTNYAQVKPETQDRKYNVTYLLKNITYTGCPNINSQPPQYPKDGANITQLKSLQYWNEQCPLYTNSGFAGYRNTHRLCTINGSNWKGNINRPEVYSTCEGRYGRPSENPVQLQLKNYTQTHLPRCANFDDFEEKQGYQIDVLNKPRVTYTFGKTDVKVNVTYPVEVSRAGQPPVTLNINFEHRIDARFKQLYEYTRDILKQEVRNITYNLSQGKSPLRREGFEVNVLKNYTGKKSYGEKWKHDDLLRVIDTESLVDGKQLMIQGYIENRRPIVPEMHVINYTREVGEHELELNLSEFIISPDSEKLHWELNPVGYTPPPPPPPMVNQLIPKENKFNFNHQFECTCDGGSLNCIEIKRIHISVHDSEGLYDSTSGTIPLELRFKAIPPGSATC